METYLLKIAKLRLLLKAEFPLNFHKYLQPFVSKEFDAAPDVIYHIKADIAPQPTGACLFSDSRMSVYADKAGEHRRFSVWNQAPCAEENPALILQNPNEYDLYCPPSRLRDYQSRFEFTPLLALEQVFAAHGRLILHSAVILHQGQAVLFCAPSGVGKSTHAALWESCFGAELLNGDRCVVEQIQTGFAAHGSPYSGSSEICKQKSAPIRGIFLLQQAKENRVWQLSQADIFRRLFPLTVVNLWNEAQLRCITRLLAELTAQLPVYCLGCRPDAEAARLAERTLFRKDDHDASTGCAAQGNPVQTRGYAEAADFRQL